MNFHGHECRDVLCMFVYEIDPCTIILIVSRSVCAGPVIDLVCPQQDLKITVAYRAIKSDILLKGSYTQSMRSYAASIVPHYKSSTNPFPYGPEWIVTQATHVSFPLFVFQGIQVVVLTHFHMAWIVWSLDSLPPVSQR